MTADRKRFVISVIVIIAGFLFLGFLAIMPEKRDEPELLIISTIAPERTPLPPLPDVMSQDWGGPDETPEPTLAPTSPPEPRSYNGIQESDVIIGELTHYDVCIACCGKVNGVTASGLVIRNGETPEIPVASCNWLPFGTIVKIDGVTHIVADRGGKEMDRIGRIDVFVPEGHQAALTLGRKRGAEITVVRLPE